jgi:hypothetical protein
LAVSDRILLFLKIHKIGCIGLDTEISENLPKFFGKKKLEIHCSFGAKNFHPILIFRKVMLKYISSFFSPKLNVVWLFQNNPAVTRLSRTTRPVGLFLNRGTRGSKNTGRGGGRC